MSLGGQEAAGWVGGVPLASPRPQWAPWTGAPSAASHQDRAGSTGRRGRWGCTPPGSSDSDAGGPCAGMRDPQRVGPPGCHPPVLWVCWQCWVTLVCWDQPLLGWTNSPSPDGARSHCGGAEQPSLAPHPLWLLLLGLCCAGGAGTGRGTSPPLIASDTPPLPSLSQAPALFLCIPLFSVH